MSELRSDMFVCVSRVTLEVPAAGSLKAKRQVLRRVTDRVKAKFNVAVAEVQDNDAHSRAVVALAVVGNERRHVSEQMDRILQFIEELYVAPILQRESETLSFGEDLFGPGPSDAMALMIPRGERSLAEAEGLGDWNQRHEKGGPPPQPSRPAAGQKKAPVPRPSLSLDDARKAARALRNRRDWERGGG